MVKFLSFLTVFEYTLSTLCMPNGYQVVEIACIVENPIILPFYSQTPYFAPPYYADAIPYFAVLRDKFFIPAFCNPINFPLGLDYFGAPLIWFLIDKIALRGK